MKGISGPSCVDKPLHKAQAAELTTGTAHKCEAAPESIECQSNQRKTKTSGVLR